MGGIVLLARGNKHQPRLGFGDHAKVPITMQ